MRKKQFNYIQMKKIFILSTTVVLLLSSCGGSKKDNAALLNDKKAALEKLKSDKLKADEQIKKLQDELAKLDTSADNSSKVKLVGVAPVTTQNFKHYIDLQGKIDADNISYISPRMGPAQVKAVYVSEGQAVKKGQLLLKLDDAIIRQQIVAAQKQMEVTKTQLSFAKNVYQRQKNLWDQGIGTEVQLLQAKSNVEQLENGLQAAEEGVKTAKEQLSATNVYSDVNGIADIVAIRVGEIFQGMTQAGPQIKIVNTSSLKVVTNVPENYLTRMRRGSVAEIFIPDVNKKINSSLSLISQSIDPLQRGFIAEAKIPYDASLKPNLTAVMKILDYNVANAIVIPVNVVQSDETGKYVYVMSKSSNGRTTAHRVSVTIGEIYGENIEIKGGLAAGEQLITDGFQNLYEGQLISTAVK